MFRIRRNFFDTGRTVFWGNSTFLTRSTHCNRHYTVKMLFAYKSMLKFVNFPLLLQGIWCRNGGGRKGWILCCNTAQPKQAIGSDTWHCADLHKICIVFLSVYSLESDLFWSDILTACICYLSYQIYTRKQAPSMLRGGLSCLLQGAGKGYFGVTWLNY